MYAFSLSFLALLCLSPLTDAAAGSPQHVAMRARFDHQAVDLVQRRQLAPQLPPPVAASTTDESVILTYVTPSPSAQPVAVTSQSQLVTSYVPQITVCALPPLAFVSGSFSNPASTGPPYLNYSVSTPSGSGTCLTTYSPTVTPICYTVLDALASKITVSDCAQNITFSTDKDFVVETPAPSPSGGSATSLTPYVRTIDTYYVAPWDEFQNPGATPDYVQVKQCTTFQNGTTICLDTIEMWYVETVSTVTTTTTHIDITTTVKGPARVMVETYHMDITEITTLFSLSTHLALDYEFQTTTTIRENGIIEPTATTTLTSTRIHTITRGVVYQTPTPLEPSSSVSEADKVFVVDDDLTTIHQTTTLLGGIMTSTIRNWNITTPPADLKR